jgi:hypothetical protein
MLAKDNPTKRAAAKRGAVLAMPTTRAGEASDQAVRIAEHRKQLEAIHDAYRRSTADAFNEPVSLARRARWRRDLLRSIWSFPNYLQKDFPVSTPGPATDQPFL